MDFTNYNLDIPEIDHLASQMNNLKVKTKKPKETSSEHDQQQNEDDNSSSDPSNKEYTDSNMGVILTTSLNEVQTDDDEDSFQTSFISGGNRQVSESSSEKSQRQSVNRDELNTLPNRVESQTQKKARKITKPTKKTLNDEINGYRRTSKNLLAKRSFQRVAMEILREHGSYRFTKEALNAVQESSELYLTHLFEDAFRLALHRKAVTLHPQDMLSVLYLRGTGNI